MQPVRLSLVFLRYHTIIRRISVVGAWVHGL